MTVQTTNITVNQPDYRDGNGQVISGGTSTVEFQTYASVEEATEHLVPYPDRLATWTDTNVSVDKRSEVLIQATIIVDRFNYIGDFPDAEGTAGKKTYRPGIIQSDFDPMKQQALKWPRKLTDDELGDQSIDDKTIPYEIEKGCALLAATLLSNPNAFSRPNEKANKNVRLQKVGPLMRMFFHPSSIYQPGNLQQIDNEAFQCLVKWFASGQQIVDPGFGYGIEGDSNNFYQEDYDRTVFGYGSSSGVRRVRGVSTA